MTNTTEAPDFPALAAQVRARALYMAEQTETDVKYGDWTDASRGRALAELYKRASAWPGLPIYRGTTYMLVCSVEGPDADVWGYVAGDLLDYVGQDLPDTARIDEIGEGKYALSW